MANNRKKGSPAGIIFALLMLIVIVIALVIVLRSCGTGGEGATTTPPVTNAVTEPSEGPASTPEGTQAPSTPSATPSATPSPTPSPTPTPTPTPSSVESSGSFRSDTGTPLNIVVNWEISGSGSSATLLVTVYAESYSLHSQGAWHAGWLTIGGQTYYFDTEAIDYDGNTQATNLLGTVAASVDTANLPATAELSWHFQGSYGDTELETITATGTIG